MEIAAGVYEHWRWTTADVTNASGPKSRMWTHKSGSVRGAVRENGPYSTMRPLGLALLLTVVSIQPSSASELSVDKRTLTMDDRLSISLALDGAFTDLDDVPLPLHNLLIETIPPSTLTHTSLT